MWSSGVGRIQRCLLLWSSQKIGTALHSLTYIPEVTAYVHGHYSPYTTTLLHDVLSLTLSDTVPSLVFRLRLCHFVVHTVDETLADHHDNLWDHTYLNGPTSRIPISSHCSNSRSVKLASTQRSFLVHRSASPSHANQRTCMPVPRSSKSRC